MSTVRWLVARAVALVVFAAGSNAYVHQQGYCMLRGQSFSNVPKLFNQPAPAVDDVEAMRERLSYICGASVADELLTPLPGTNTSRLCCDDMQIATLQNQFSTPVPLISSCPACWNNFAAFFCRFTCSPSQSLFLEPQEPLQRGGYVDHSYFYVTSPMIDGFYDSCKEVKYGSANSLAMDFIAPKAKSGIEMVNRLGIKVIGGSPIWLEFFTDPAVFPENVTALDAPPAVCDSSDPDVRCSCVDCLKACTLDLGPLPDGASCYVGSRRLDCVAFSAIIIYVVVLVAFIASLLLKCGISRIFNRGRTLVAMNSNPFGADVAADEAAPMLSPPAGDINIHQQRRFVPWPVDSFLQGAFFKLGSFCARRWLIVIGASVCSVAILSTGWTYFGIETQPIKLWVDPESQALAQKDYFDTQFAPFYRITQLIVSHAEGDHNRSVVEWEFLDKVWTLQAAIEEHSVLVELEPGAPQVSVSMDDLCYRPTQTACATQSFTGWYKGNRKDFVEDRDKDLSNLKKCAFQSGNQDCFAPSGQPLTPNLVLGGVSNPNVPHNESDPKWRESWLDAKAAVVTFVLNNPKDEKFQKMAVAWEQSVIKLIQASLDDNTVHVAYSTESSVEEELSRDMLADVPTVALSYALMFLYASLALGKFSISKPRRFLVDSKFSLGVAGILIVMASVSASVGLLSFFQVKATLIIAEVIPFLVLAVGVDNIFILVNTFERITAACERSGTLHPVETRVALALSNVGPSILLSSLSETIAFGLGFFVTMPAVSVFSLYAAVAVLINILLQITLFVSLLTLDTKRRESGRLDCLPCVHMDDDDVPQPGVPYDIDLPVLERLFKKYYAPVLLGTRRVKLSVVLVFLTIFVFLGVFNVSQVPAGLDQKIALPKDSYLINYFDAIETFLEVGPPLYFVVLTGADGSGRNNYSLNALDRNDQKKICGKFQDCNSDSISRVLEMEYQRTRNNLDPELQSTIATPVASWFDDFVTYMNVLDRPCCVQNKDPYSCYLDPSLVDPDDDLDEIGFGQEPDNFNTDCGCWKWRAFYPPDAEGLEPMFNYFLTPALRRPEDAGGLPLNQSQILHSLDTWLDHQPSRRCPTAGKAAYSTAIKRGDGDRIEAFHFRTYHRVLRTQQDFIDGYRDAKRISDNIMRLSLGIDDPSKAKVEFEGKEYPPVFPYSIYYVFFEQYLLVSGLATTMILTALAAIFVVVTIFLGSPATALVIVAVVGMMTIDLLGIMSVWGISLNAVSVVNLVIGVGIGVEFCVHVARGVVTEFRYTVPRGGYTAIGTDGNAVNMGSPIIEENAAAEDESGAVDAVQRSLVEMGSSVFSGITLTKLIGIAVLASAHSTIFEVFYFRMYFSIVLLGATHGLILLPVLMSLLHIGEWSRGMRGAEGAVLLGRK